MLLLLRKNGLTSFFKEVRVFKECHRESFKVIFCLAGFSKFARLFGNGQVSLIFGIPNFCTFSLLVLCLFMLQVEAKNGKN